MWSTGAIYVLDSQAPPRQLELATEATRISVIIIYVTHISGMVLIVLAINRIVKSRASQPPRVNPPAPTLDAKS
jgi:hypothetical protein